MKRGLKLILAFSLIITIVFLSAFSIYKFKPELYQQYSRKVPYQLRIPTSHTRDEAKLLSYSYEFRLNQFLDYLETNYGIAFQVHLLSSSQGFNINEKIRPLIDSMNDHERFGIFFLSLSDRQFKIYLSPILENQLGSETVSFLVELVKPALTRLKYEEGLTQFFSLFSFKIDPNSEILPPRPSVKEGQNSKTLITFLGAIIFFFLLGRKLFTRPRALMKTITKQNNNSLTRYQSFY